LRRLLTHWTVWAVVGVLWTLASAWAITRHHQEIAGAVPLGVLWVFLGIRHPRLALGGWFIALCTIPHWLNVHAGGTWPPGSLIGLTVLPAALWHLRMRLHIGDLLVLGAIACCVVAYMYGGTPQAQLFALIVQGGIAYVIGRGLVPAAGVAWTTGLIAGMCTFLGGWAIVEQLAHWHPFVGLDRGSTEGFWADIQYRGGRARSEAAFGHAIVLGGAIAAGVPFILASRWSNVGKVAAIVIVGFGILATGSRGPMIAALLGLGLTLLFFAAKEIQTSTRLAIAAIGVIVGWGMLQLLSSLVSSAGSEAELSADYRNQLYSHIASDARPLSVARHVQFDPTGAQTWRAAFGSVDSSFIQYALVFGYLPVLLLLVAAAFAIVRVLARRANIAEIALVAQLPVLATVALITQYYLFAWFLLGAAVAVGGPRAVAARTPARAAHRSPRPAALKVSAEST
jgi:hypothetical protein